MHSQYTHLGDALIGWAWEMHIGDAFMTYALWRCAWEMQPIGWTWEMHLGDAFTTRALGRHACIAPGMDTTTRFEVSVTDL